MVAITTGAQTLTAAGAVTPSAGADLSAATKPATIELVVSKLSCASGTPTARIVIEESVTDFTAGDSFPLAVFDIVGPINSPLNLSAMNDHIPNCKAGVTSALIRANVVILGGTTPTITLSAALLP